MFSWFTRKPRPLHPESKWVITVEDDRISVCDDAGKATSVAKRDLSGIAIETNDSGPWGADVWWMLFDDSDQLACAFPQGATGEEAAIDYFSALPLFNHEEMFRAMTCTDNAVFPVWRRPS